MSVMSVTSRGHVEIHFYVHQFMTGHIYFSSNFTEWEGGGHLSVRTARGRMMFITLSLHAVTSLRIEEHIYCGWRSTRYHCEDNDK